MRIPPGIGGMLVASLCGCSPEESFLNTTEKREVARRTEERTIMMRDSVARDCLAYQDSLLPYLVDSLLVERTREMQKRLEQQ
ncbi:MAG: hypothetical protein J5I41_10320 [Saprospiraceae bacterium]|nr:hypothetical protein [Saprospiraceae bacterium]